MKVALLYDFDKTLSTKDMQEFGLLNELGYDQAEEFWEGVHAYAREHQMDSILAYLYITLREAKRQGLRIDYERLKAYAEEVVFYPGVKQWFERLNRLAQDMDIQLEHYIISSGIKEIVENTVIAPYFREIYACEYLYDETGEAVWPKLALNYTLKTQFLYRINKGVWDVSNDYDLNRHTEHEKRHVPFTHMIYIGDGLTDVPSMKLIRTRGGHAIAVYPFGEDPGKITQSLKEDERVDFICEADYREGEMLEKVVYQIFKTLKSQADLERLRHGK